MSHCPGEATLRLLGAGTLGDATYEAIEQHVEGCPKCKAVVELLAHRHADPTTVSPDPPRVPHIPGFEIVSELDHGAMGVIYRAIEIGLDRPVALKILPGAFGSGPSSNARRHWLREARAVSRVPHPNIVPLYDFGEADGCFFLVLQYVPGGSLKKRLEGPLLPRTAAGLMETIARAVGFIHRKGLLHLDLKPSNILLEGEPDARWETLVPRVSDFGLAVSDHHDDVSETSLAYPRGTPSYMAPEQASANRLQIGAASDIHALGAVLYELLTGRPPFQAASTWETLEQVRSQNALAPRRLNAKIPRDLETIAFKCLEKNPLRRYASAEVLADDLRRWLDGFPIEARPVSNLERAARWCRRRPALASLVAALAFTVMSSLVGLLTLWRHSEAERRRAEQALARAGESDEATSGAVHDLVGLLATTVDAPQMLVAERNQTASRVICDLTAKLRRHRVFTTSNLVAICGLEHRFAVDFRRRGNYVESRALLMDSLELLGGRRLGPDDPDVDEAYARALMELGDVARNQEHFDEALAWSERAEEALERMVRAPQQLELIAAIDQARRAIAGLLGRRGLEEQRRTLLEPHIRMLDRLSARANGDPAIGLLATLARLDLAPDPGASAKLRVAIRRFPGNGQLPQLFRENVADWIATDVQPYPRGSSSTGEWKSRLDPDAYARTLFRALESKCEAVGVVPSLLPWAALQAAGNAASLTAEQRNAGRLDDARQTTACLSAFAELLARTDPDEATFHLILSMAFEQESKNAWKVKDFTKIDEGLKKALGEASAALSLDPRNALARGCVAILQDKLVKLAAGRRERAKRNAHATISESHADAVGVSSQ